MEIYMDVWNVRNDLYFITYMKTQNKFTIYYKDRGRSVHSIHRGKSLFKSEKEQVKEMKKFHIEEKMYGNVRNR